jgi:hypothetical protein
MSDASPGRKLSTTASSGELCKSDRKNPPVKRINNRYPQVRKGGKAI